MITLKEFFSFKKNRFFWLNLIAMIVVIIGVCWGTLLWLDSYTHHGEAYMVPNVKNKTLNEAQQALSNQKLKGLVIDSSYVKGVPDGMVLDQNPAGGARVKEGRTIYLTVTTSKAGLDRQQLFASGGSQIKGDGLQTDGTGIRFGRAGLDLRHQIPWKKPG